MVSGFVHNPKPVFILRACRVQTVTERLKGISLYPRALLFVNPDKPGQEPESTADLNTHGRTLIPTHLFQNI